MAASGVVGQRSVGLTSRARRPLRALLALLVATGAPVAALAAASPTVVVPTTIAAVGEYSVTRTVAPAPPVEPEGRDDAVAAPAAPPGEVSGPPTTVAPADAGPVVERTPERTWTPQVLAFTDESDESDEVALGVLVVQPPAIDVTSGGAPGLNPSRPAATGLLSPSQIYAVARAAGFSDRDAAVWTAIALAESGGNPYAHNGVGEDSWGLWQINLDAHRSWAGDLELTDPLVNAQAAFRISEGGRSLGPWTVTHASRGAPYLSHLPLALAAAGDVLGSTALDWAAEIERLRAGVAADVAAGENPVVIVAPREAEIGAPAITGAAADETDAAPEDDAVPEDDAAPEDDADEAPEVDEAATAGESSEPEPVADSSDADGREPTQPVDADGADGADEAEADGDGEDDADAEDEAEDEGDGDGDADDEDDADGDDEAPLDDEHADGAPADACVDPEVADVVVPGDETDDAAPEDEAVIDAVPAVDEGDAAPLDEGESDTADDGEDAADAEPDDGGTVPGGADDPLDPCAPVDEDTDPDDADDGDDVEDPVDADADPDEALADEDEEDEDVGEPDPAGAPADAGSQEQPVAPADPELVVEDELEAREEERVEITAETTD